jgi:hypothetical protein
VSAGYSCTCEKVRQESIQTIYQLIGGGFSGWGVALAMAAASFVLMAFAEYEREKDE